MVTEKGTPYDELAKQLEDQFTSEKKSYFYYAEVSIAGFGDPIAPLSGVTESSQSPLLVFEKICNSLHSTVKEVFDTVDEDKILVTIKQFNTL